MYRRSIALLAEKGKRTIVRDPRKRKLPAIQRTQDALEAVQEQDPPPVEVRQRMAFEPMEQNQQAVGSTLGSYALMGAGMAVGFSIVGAIFGGF
mmetsp:Transcript_29284/g.43172  ORF Transcript_29284/g.43172 Transcript_29284/m.43172 type:complete len:94 (-) Transcript_29284:35-316(-)